MIKGTLASKLRPPGASPPCLITTCRRVWLLLSHNHMPMYLHDGGGALDIHRELISVPSKQLVSRVGVNRAKLACHHITSRHHIASYHRPYSEATQMSCSYAWPASVVWFGSMFSCYGRWA